MPFDDDQLANLDAELDDLVAPTTAEVLDHSQDYDAGFVAASAARRAINGSGGGGGAPSGPAGGVLGGTYPDPSFASDMATQAELDAAVAALQPIDSDLTAIAALTTTSFGRGLLALADAAALLSSAGAAAAVHAHAGEDITSGTVADARIASTIARDSEVAAGYQPLDSDLTSIAALTTTTYGRSLLETANAAALQTLAALVPGTNVQAFDAELAAIAGLTSAADKLPYFTGSGTAALADLSTFMRTVLDDTTAAAVRTTLGSVPWPRKYKTGLYYMTNQGVPADSVMTPVKDTVYYHAFPVGEALTFDRIGTGVQTAGTATSVVRLGIYNDTDGMPDALLLDAGTINGTSNTYQEITVTQALSAGTLYWVAVCWQVAAVGVLRASGVGGGAEWVGLSALNSDPRVSAYTQLSVTGAFPANATPAASTIAQTAAVKVRAV